MKTPRNVGSRCVPLTASAVLGLLSIAVAGAALAGTSFTSVTRSETEGRKGHPGAQETRMHGVVDGLGSRVEFLDSSNPMMPAGTYQVSNDGGKTRYVVDPKEKTYFALDLEGSMAALKGAGMDMTIENVKLEKLVDEGGPTMLGLSTRHHKYRTSYTMTMKIMGTRTSSQITTEDETWSAPKLTDPALALWLRPENTGMEGLDKLMTAEMSKMEGFPLKRIHTSTTKDGSGKRAATDRTSTLTMEVTELKAVSPTASTFVVPAGYQKTELDMMKVLMKARPQHGKPERERE